MNVNEYGIQFAFWTGNPGGGGFNLAGFTSLQINFTKPDGTALTVTNLTTPNAVSISNQTLVTSLGTFAPNTYFLYTFKNGDVNQAGAWTARAIYTDAVQHLISGIATFTIGP